MLGVIRTFLDNLLITVIGIQEASSIILYMTHSYLMLVQN